MSEKQCKIIMFLDGDFFEEMITSLRDKDDKLKV